LRRLQYKIEVLPPSLGQFKEIFRRVAGARNLEWNEEAFAYLLREHYQRAGREPQACHPRDLINHMLSISRYYDVPPRMTQPMIDHAVRSYFVRLSGM
jgi:hypothetical protein